MRSLPRYLWCALALLSVPSVAWADEPSPAKWAEQRIDAALVKPLAKAESSRFSRERPPPRERRIRITQATPISDKRGRAYVSFAIDVRFGPEWHENDITGCAYRGSGEVFVKIGDAYRPAAFLLGKNLQPVPGVCEEGAPARS